VSAGLGWSLQDVRILAHFAEKIRHALKDEGGSSSEYQQATTTLLASQLTLGEIQRGLQSTGPSFRNAIKGQIDGSGSSIARSSATLQEKYSDASGLAAEPRRHCGT